MNGATCAQLPDHLFNDLIDICRRAGCPRRAIGTRLATFALRTLGALRTGFTAWPLWPGNAIQTSRSSGTGVAHVAFGSCITLRTGRSLGADFALGTLKF